MPSNGSRYQPTAAALASASSTSLFALSGSHTWDFGVILYLFNFCSGGDRQEKAACKQTADCQPNQGSASGASDGAAEKKEAVKCLAAKVSHITDAHTARQAVYWREAKGIFGFLRR